MTTSPRALIASDNRELVVHIVDAYQRNGYEVATGVRNFFFNAMRFDVVHILWPEELSQWTAPGDDELERIETALDRWNRSSRTLFTVNNLAPHIDGDNPAYQRLYRLFHSRCRAVYHHSRKSLDMAVECYRFEPANHHVTSLFNFERALPDGEARGDPRPGLGLRADEFVVLAFGALRFIDELDLLRTAFDRAAIPGKRLLMCGRIQLAETSRVRRALARHRWNRWLVRRDALVPSHYIADDELHRYFEAADVAVVPRSTGLISGLVPMAMTFGCPIAAPDFGAFPEYLRGTDNAIYPTGSAAGLGAALEALAQRDRKAIGRHNKAVAGSWGWTHLLEEMLKTVHARR